ncbi:MAG: cytochrome C oxidase subunit I [Betaproteobacteria bacterium]|nr:cytochrome C oxidase subunit I [Betaproteobacteria bacterium]
MGSYLLYSFWKPAPFVNYGELVVPEVVITPAPDDAMSQTLKEVSGKWVLAMADSGSCGEFCQKKLYYLRQIRLTQGKYMGRIERLWIITDEVRPNESVLKDFQGTRVVSARGSAWVGRIPVKTSLTDHLLIIDPLGNVILRYPRDLDPSAMKKDLQRLLRASRVG